MRFTYHAFDLAGKPAPGATDAADAAEAAEMLRRRGLYVTGIQPAPTELAAGASPPAGPSWGGASGASPAPRPALPWRQRLGKGRRMRNLAMFTRQLYVLVSSGTPLVAALSSLERQAAEPAWRDVLAGVRLKVEEGATLAGAMETQPQVFDAVCRSLIAAGESGGGFDAMLDRLAGLTRRQIQTRSAIMGAMIYPMVLVVTATIVMNMMLLFVLPRFAGLFATLDVPLPPTTQALMDLSGLVRGYWWAGIGGAAVCAAAGRWWARRPAGKWTIDHLVLRAPLVGPIFRALAVARITRVLGVLLNGKVPLLEALRLARETVSNVHFAALVTQAREAVNRGSSVSSAFAESDLISPSLTEAIRSGERSGQLGALLLNIADFLDEENEVVIKSLTSILEPVILCVLGLFVGLMAVSMFLPLFDLTSMTQGVH